MKELTWQFPEVKEKLPAGPWREEPDKVQWVDEATGLDCLIVRGPLGALCGYVGVSEGHPFFGRDYDQVPEDGTSLSVHGGVTFSDFCAEDGKEHGICHRPFPGRPEKVYWFGFDCAHFMDLVPYTLKVSPNFAGTIYRDISYVKAQCADLAQQLKAVQ